MDYRKIKDGIKSLILRAESYLKTDLTYFIKGSFWLFGSQVGTWIFGFILSTILANILTKEFFGNYQFVLAIMGTIGAFSLTGMNTAVTRAVAQGKDKVFIDSIKVQIKWNGLMMIVGFIVGAYYILNNNGMIGLAIVVASIFIPLANAFNTYSAFLNGKKDFKRMATYGIEISFAVSLFVLGASLLYKSIPFIVGVYSAITFLANFLIYKKIVKQNNFDGESDEVAIKYGKHLSLVNALSSVSQSFDQIILFHYLGGVVLASYFVATLIPGNLSNFFRSIPSLSLPKFSQRSFEEIREKIYHKLLITLLVSFFLAIAYIIVAPIVFHFIFPKYSDIIGLTRVYSLIIIFSGPTILMGSVLGSQAMVKQIYTYNILNFITKLVVIFVGIKIAGVYGLAWGMVIFNTTMAITLFILISKNITKKI